MNSRERVRAALHFNNPDKVPVFNLIKGDIGPLIITHSKNWNPGWNEGEKGLFPHVRGSYKWNRPEWVKNKPEYEGNKWRTIPHEEIDEWGCIWNMKGNDKNQGHPGRPSLLNWDDFDTYFERYAPDADDKTRYEFALNTKRNLSNDTYFLLIFPSYGPSQVVSAMRGFNNYLLDHKKNPKELQKALEAVAEFQVKCMKNAIKLGINPDGIWIVDDLGEQKGPFFSPKTFRKMYESSYKYVIDEAHALGIEVHHHCCGKVDPLLPVLIDWGLDAIEFDSPRMSGYPNLSPYRGKIMFWACANIQSLYPLGTPDQIEREVWHMMRNLGTKNGGYGVFFYDDYKDINVPRKNIKALEHGVEKYGDYSTIPAHWWDYPTPNEWNDFEVPPLPPLDT
ncbi:MAG: uroporphyrinogen decarboxylase family protein [Promethearchaeota archaeon]